jgi:Domain of unknown function (DUF4371)
MNPYSFRVVFSRTRRGPTPGSPSKKQKVVGDTAAHGPSNSGGPLERVDIADCLTSDYRTINLTCFPLLQQDLNHPVDIKRYAGNLQRDAPIKVPFSLQILKDFDFLEYSAKWNSFLCRYCSLGFAPGNHQGPLITQPVTNFARSAEIVRQHASRNYHEAAALQGKQFALASSCLPMNSMEFDIQTPLTAADFPPQLLAAVTSIVKTNILNSRQGLAFQKSVRILNKNFEYTADHLYRSVPWSYATFEAALLFRLDAGDADLLAHLQSTNPKFVSEKSQNKILSLIFVDLQTQIMAEIHRSPYFSILLDGTTDASGKEQLAFVIRYLVDENIREQFIEFVDASDSTTGMNLS